MNWRPSWFSRIGSEREPSADAREEARQRAERSTGLGRRLRDARVMAGLSFADVERDTRINRAYIEAIEEARFEEMPAPVYARGFVRSYARYLGLDPEEAVASMPLDLPRPAGLEPMPGLRRTVAPAIPAINPPIAAGIGLAVTLVLLAVFVLPNLGGGGGLPGDGGNDETATATSTEAGTPSGGTGTPGAPAATGTAPTGATVPPFEEGTAPDFTGATRAEAERILAELGVTPVIVEAVDASPAGLVFDQSPAPGTDLQSGDVVTLFISQGP